MKFRWLLTILAVALGTGWVAAQGEAPTVVSTMPATELSSPSCAGDGYTLADDGHPQYSMFAYGQMLFWNLRDANLPNLTTSIPVGFATVTTTSTVGGVALPTVTTPVPVSIQSRSQVPGASEIDTSNHLGFRGGVGVWFGDCRQWGVELSGFGLEEKSQGFRLSNSSNPQSLNINTGLVVVTSNLAGVVLQSTPVIFPRQAFTSTTGQFSTNLWGAEANVLKKGWYYGPLLLSYLTGVRYQEFEEDATVTSNATFTRPAGAADPVGATFPDPLNYSTFDRIKTRNQFYGVQIGLEADLVYGRVFFNAKGKVALGDIRQEVNVLGMNTFNGTTTSGGLLSGAGDQGTYTRDKVGFLPELNFKAGYQFSDAVRIYVGYDVLYMQHVVRPGGQTELATLNTQLGVANTNALVNVVQPVTRLRDMDVWVQGINGGLELRY